MWEKLAGNCCGKILQENLEGNSCGKNLQENLVEEILWENLAGKSCGKNVVNLAGNVVGKFLLGKSCWKILEMLWGNVSGKSCGKKYLRGNCSVANLVGNSCLKILWKNLLVNLAGNVGKFLLENLAGNVVGNCCREKLAEKC